MQLLKTTIREEADGVLVEMSFKEEDQPNRRPQFVRFCILVDADPKNWVIKRGQRPTLQEWKLAALHSAQNAITAEIQAIPDT